MFPRNIHTSIFEVCMFCRNIHASIFKVCTFLGIHTYIHTCMHTYIHTYLARGGVEVMVTYDKHTNLPKLGRYVTPLGFLLSKIKLFFLNFLVCLVFECLGRLFMVLSIPNPETNEQDVFWKKLLRGFWEEESSKRPSTRNYFGLRNTFGSKPFVMKNSQIILAYPY